MVDISGYLTGPSMVVILLAGLILAFFGKTFFKATWFLVGGLIGAAIGLAIGYFLGPYFHLNEMVCPIIGAIVGFVAGGFLVLSWVRRIMCMMIAGAGFIMAFAIAGIFVKDVSMALIIAVIVGVVIFIIAYILFDAILSVMTAFLGGVIIGAVIAYKFFPGNILIVTFVIGIPIAIAGAAVQLHLHKKYPEHSYDKDKDPQVKDAKS
jgi:hypothetical protein